MRHNHQFVNQETLYICTWGISIYIGYMDQQLKQKQAINRSLRLKLNAEKDIKERTLVQLENYDLWQLPGGRAVSLASIAYTSINC